MQTGTLQKEFIQRTGPQRDTLPAFKVRSRIRDTLQRGESDWGDAKGLIAAGFSDAEVLELTYLTGDELERAKVYAGLAPELIGPDEIEKRAAAIRSQWNDEERELRRVHIPPIWYLPGFGYVT